MSHDDFESERGRVEHVIRILEHATVRLQTEGHVPLSLLTDALAFINQSEEAAYEAMLDEDEPALTRCFEQHTAVQAPLSTMRKALAALADGDTTAVGRFSRAVAEYVKLRSEHLAVDDRLFAKAVWSAPPVDLASTPLALAESPDTRQLYDRVVDAGKLLDQGVSTGRPPEPRQATPVSLPTRS